MLSYHQPSPCGICKLYMPPVYNSENSNSVVYCVSVTVDYLLDQTDDDMVNITNTDGRTCLHIAALTNNLPLCELLVMRGANPKSLMEGKVSRVFT